MSGPAPATTASRPDLFRRVTGLLRVRPGAPLLGLLIAAVLMAFLFVNSPPTAQAAPPDAPTAFSIDTQSVGVTVANFDSLGLLWTPLSGTVDSHDISVDDGSTWKELISDGTAGFADISARDFGMYSGNTYRIRKPVV